MLSVVNSTRPAAAGGTSGIGFHAAKQYVTKGAHVIIAGRNEDLGKE